MSNGVCDAHYKKNETSMNAKKIWQTNRGGIQRWEWRDRVGEHGCLFTPKVKGPTFTSMMGFIMIYTAYILLLGI